MERANLRRTADRERRLAERQAKQHPDKMPETRDQTFDERRASRTAEAEGRRLVAARAAERAAELAGPINPYRQRANELESQTFRPEAKRRFQQMSRLADQWDREADATKAEAERQQKIANNPMVKLALENSDYVLQLADADDKTAVVIAQTLARAGDTEGYWERIKPVEARILARENLFAAERLATRNATQAEFIAAANQAEQIRERLGSAEQAANDLEASPAE